MSFVEPIFIERRSDLPSDPANGILYWIKSWNRGATWSSHLNAWVVLGPERRLIPTIQRGTQ